MHGSKRMVQSYLGRCDKVCYPNENYFFVKMWQQNISF